MFNSLDMTGFGTYLKNIRKNLKYTQNEVYDIVGINSKTLRKIENGEVIPKYKTIELLSSIYREDLMISFNLFRKSTILFDIYKQIDNEILNHNEKNISRLKREIEKLNKNPSILNLVNVNELKQLNIFTMAIIKFYDEDHKECIKLLNKALLYTHKNFSMNNPFDSKLNTFENRLILLIALCSSKLNSHEYSIDLMIQLLKILLKNKDNDEHNRMLIIKIYLNISYDYFNMSKHQKTIKYASDGIKFCRDNFSMYCLYFLYFRRGIAKYKIGNNGYRNDLKSCFQCLSLLGRNDLISEYKSILKTRHDIIL